MIPHSARALFVVGLLAGGCKDPAASAPPDRRGSQGADASATTPVVPPPPPSEHASVLPPGSALGAAPAGGGRLSLCRPAASAERVRSGPDTSALGCPARIEPEHGTGKLWALDEGASKGKPGNATCCYYDLP